MPDPRHNWNRLLSIFLALVLAMLLPSCGAVVCLSFSSGPAITTVTPGSVLVGGAQVQITIIGTNFGNNAVVVLSDGTQLQPVTLNGSQMVVILPADHIVTPGTLIVSVSNPCGGFSNTIAVRVVV
jgi:IPT/TIG domain-containing protein